MYTSQNRKQLYLTKMLEYLIVNQLIQLVMVLHLDAEIPQHDVRNYFLHYDALLHCPHMRLHRQSPPKKEKHKYH